MPSNKVVVVAFDLNVRYSAELFRGVSDFVSEQHLDWRLLPLGFDFEGPVMELAASGQLFGVIGSFISDRWIHRLQGHAVHTVNLFQLSPIKATPSVCIDDFSVGERAARHLSEQAARSYVFYCADNLHSTQLRRQGFFRALAGRPVSNLSAAASKGYQIQQLDSMPQPIGAFCATDHLARRLIKEARGEGWQIGRNLLVLGSDNDPSESIFAEIGISSFQLPAHEIGRTAAQRLSEQARGASTTEPLCFVSAPQLIVRESTLPPGQARIAQAAINSMQDRLGDPTLDIAKLCRDIGVSRRSLELAFQKKFKTSPYQKLIEYRLAHARQLLTQSNLSIEAVGKASGYPEPHHFSAWFKKHVGKSPKHYRDAS